MRYSRLWHPLFGCIALALASCQPQASLEADPTCADFLASWNKESAALQFVECERVEHPQVDRLVASYVVEGARAESVEQFLQQEFGMSSLQFLCCGWETFTSAADINTTPYGRYVDASGFEFDIQMYSAETLIQDRAQWNQIPEFYVRVRMWLGSP